jgi:RNA polymerase sigma factor (sigma-70 family)
MPYDCDTSRSAPTPAPPAEVSNLLLESDSGDPERAWAAFLDRHTRLLLQVAFRFAGGSYDEAMDAYAYMLDELRRNDYARLRAYVASEQCTFAHWLVVVCRRLCLDHYRRKYGRPRGTGRARARTAARRDARRRLARLSSHSHELAGLPDLATPDPSLALEALLETGALRAAVARLGPDDRMLLELRFEQDLTAREIATVLGLPSPFAVYRRLKRVCDELRSHVAA